MARGVERAEFPFSRRAGRIHELRDALSQTMWDDVGVLRNRDAMEHGLGAISGHRAALRNIGVADGDRRFNLTWHDWLNLESLVDISKVITVSALARENSRGAHYREDFSEPGDLHTSCYTRVSAQDGELQLEMVPVSFDIVKPGESLIEGEAGIPQS
jgi:fumarate reductase flavoprotein subunit